LRTKAGVNPPGPIAALRSKALLAMTFYESAPLEHKLKDRLPQSPEPVLSEAEVAPSQ
jgi:hypothetical protein